MSTKKWTPAMDAAIITLRQEGLLYREIGDRLGVSERVARSRASRLGIPTYDRVFKPNGRPKRWTPELEEKAVKMRATHTIGEIADAFGMRYETVRNHLKVLDIPNARPAPRTPKNKATGPLGELELAPGHFAVDAKSYELIREAAKAAEGGDEWLTTL